MSLLMFENAIMCDMLEGLYKSFDSLVGSYSVTNKIYDEYQVMTNVFGDIVKEHVDNQSTFRRAVVDRDNVRTAYNALLEKRENYDDVRGKVIKSYKTTIKILRQDLENERKKREVLTQEFEELEKKYTHTNTELNSLRRKIMKQLKSTEAFLHVTKVCINCSQVYTEEGNFNWSCRTHLSKYNGENYWCCGSSDRHAVGCVSGKHACKEDGEHDLHKGMLLFCSNCKERGHFSRNCPKDPNAKSGFEGEEEHERIADCKKHKQKVLNYVIQRKVAETLVNYGLYHTESAASESSEEVVDESVKAFRDIFVLKDCLPDE